MAAMEPGTVPAPARRGRTASPVPEDVAAGATSGPENITQIRDILFGQQMAEYDRRFAELENFVAASTGAIKAELGSRLDAVEASLTERMESLADDLRGETADKVRGVEQHLETVRKALEKELKKLAEALDLRAGTLGDAVTAATDALRHELAAQSESDRARLAGLLGGVAAQLTDAPESAESIPAET